MDEDWPRNEEERNGTPPITKWTVTVRNPFEQKLGFIAVTWERVTFSPHRWEARSAEGWVSSIYCPDDTFPSVDLTTDALLLWDSMRNPPLTRGLKSDTVKETDWPEWFNEQ